MFDAIGVIIGVIFGGGIGLLLFIGGAGAGSGAVMFLGGAIMLVTIVGAYRNWPASQAIPIRPPDAAKRPKPDRPLAKLD